MMITIHGLPVTTKYQDLKILIKQECNINDFILDCLVNENDGTKKVRVGLANDSEGNHIIKCLNGYRMSGNTLRLTPVGKSAPSNIPQQSSFETRDNYQARNEYPSQGFNERNSNRLGEAARPTPWAVSNQWSSNQPVQTQLPSSYSYQQQPPINTSYGSQTNPPLKPQFESRDTVPTGRGPQEAPPYGYNTKSNLISLGPKETYHQRNIPSTLREIPVASRPIQSSRYPTQNYEMQTEKPITIMKDNFQGPNQYNVGAIHSQGSGNYPVQIQPSPWASQQQQKQFEKPSTIAYDKKLYEDRKYPQVSQMKSVPEIPSKSEDPYKGYDKSRHFSPPRRGYGRDTAPERRISPSDRDVSHSSRNIMPGRRSPGRRISPSGRQPAYADRRSPGRRVSPGRRSSPSNRAAMHSSRDISPSERRISPSARHIVPSGRHVSPGRRLSPPSRRISPPTRPIMVTERHISPHSRRFSPTGRQPPQIRQVSPGRKMSPIRKLSPSHRRDSPQVKKEEYARGRRVSPPSHSPMDRRVVSRPSPSRVVPRGVAPHRQESPRRQGRYSPPRLPDKTQDYQDDRRASIKSVRPAYEPQTQASDEAIYSGGYRHTVREDAQYPVSRQDWQDREKAFPPKNVIEDRRDVPRLQKFDIQRASDQQRPIEQESKRSRSRTSRSPRRERSPLRDRYKRHSPSPRSPRRSWALEKRRSPEARDPPPPPVWPGQDAREEYSHQTRSKIHDRQIEKHVAVWEPREKKRDDYPPADNRRDFEEEIRVRKDVGKWKPLPLSSPQESSSRLEDKSRVQKEYTRKDFEGHHDYIREGDIRKSHSDRVDKGYQRQDREVNRYKSDHERRDDIPRKREEYSGRIEEKKKEILEKQEQLQKEIDEVYKRAVDFTKKAVMYRKGEHKKEGYSSDRRRDEDHIPNDYEQRYKQDSYDERHNRDDLSKEYSKEIFSRNDDVKSSSESIAQKPRFEIDVAQKRHALSPTMKAKRSKAIDEISEKILCKYGGSLPSEIKKRVQSELKWTLGRKLHELFGDKDVSFIEMVIKFNAKHTQKDEENIFDEVVSSLPSHYRNMKRVAQDDSDVPAKNSRRSTEPNFNKERPVSQREALKPKMNTVSERKRSVEVTQRSPETKPLKQKTVEKEVKGPVPARKPELDVETEVTEEQEGGQFELNALMTRVLEEELKTIMIEVWQALPDDPPTEAERFVAEKLRNEASDEIRNVLGLNVTKRLLNVYNPLFVKIHFSCRPESGCLAKFLDDYKIKGFKRIHKETNTFAARLTSITDFDNICSAKDIRCGSAKITVSPCYRFSQCPKKLNTIFADKDEQVGTEKDETNEIEDDEKEAVTSKEKIILESNTREEKITNAPKEKKLQDKIGENEASEITQTQKSILPEKVKAIENVIQKKTVVTKSHTSENNPKIEEVNKMNKVKSSTDKLDISGKKTKIVENKTIKCPTTKAITSEIKPKLKEPKENNKIKRPIAKPVPKIVSKESSRDKILSKPLKATAIKQNMNINEDDINDFEINNEFDENDEMNDEEILALISGGVIVDECIGSDDE
ncbi:microtubule-associated protein futsch-like isoform X4 [Vanessa cardui]|uniref:microtubule-associated protein futsch-like isoform X4 n=1 Tax=Vanessa cardui TaxID=171605 RepID=UPI001F130B11|nr:microtubule-associated protein futsch-like isoform X4 [Vanessa cardui]